MPDDVQPDPVIIGVPPGCSLRRGLGLRGARRLVDVDGVGTGGSLGADPAIIAGRMAEPFVEMLKGGHPNSLGRTEEVVAIVVADGQRLEELFASVAESDELVRLRAGDALEKVCRERPGWFRPHVDRLIAEVGAIEQPSVQWHVAQMLHHLRGDLSNDQARRATALLQRNLAQSTDWIVLNVTMDVLAEWAADDPALADWLIPVLERLRADPRKSVAMRAAKRLERFG